MPSVVVVEGIKDDVRLLIIIDDDDDCVDEASNEPEYE